MSISTGAFLLVAFVPRETTLIQSSLQLSKHSRIATHFKIQHIRNRDIYKEFALGLFETSGDPVNLVLCLPIFAYLRITAITTYLWLMDSLRYIRPSLGLVSEPNVDMDLHSGFPEIYTTIHSPIMCLFVYASLGLRCKVWFLISTKCLYYVLLVSAVESILLSTGLWFRYSCKILTVEFIQR